MTSLTSARDLAAKAIRKAQNKYKHQYDRSARQVNIRLGDWVLVYFPQDESGRWRKLSRPWHGPYRVVEVSTTGVTCTKVYFPQEVKLHVHQSRVCVCPQEFPAGYYWYGGKRKGPGRPPKWVDKMLQSGPSCTSDAIACEGDQPGAAQEDDPKAGDTVRTDDTTRSAGAMPDQEHDADTGGDRDWGVRPEWGTCTEGSNNPALQHEHSDHDVEDDGGSCWPTLTVNFAHKADHYPRLVDTERCSGWESVNSTLNLEDRGTQDRGAMADVGQQPHQQGPPSTNSREPPCGEKQDMGPPDDETLNHRGEEDQSLQATTAAGASQARSEDTANGRTRTSSRKLTQTGMSSVVGCQTGNRSPEDPKRSLRSQRIIKPPAWLMKVTSSRANFARVEDDVMT